MANIYYLNQPARPFWGFLSNLEDHPFFSSARGPWAFSHGEDHSERRPQGWGDFTASRGEEPAAGPSNDTGFRGGSERGKDHSFEGRGRSCGSRGGGHHPFHHARGRGGPMRGGCDPRHSRGGAFAHNPRGGPFAHGPRGDLFGGSPHDHHSHHDRRDRGPPPPEVFADLPAFLGRLGEQLGFPIDQMFNHGSATGASRDAAGNAQQHQVDFTPSVDIFDTATEYIVQVSLPGAKRPDLSVDYDAEESVLRLAGVVYRPGITEELHTALVVDERRNHVGVFEREVRLGTRAEPANVNVEGISAKLEDGVLIVTLPKVPAAEDQGKKKKVRLETEENNEQIYEKEKDKEEAQDQHMQLDSETERGDATFSPPTYQQASVEEYTPEGSEGEEEEEESREYVHVDVQ